MPYLELIAAKCKGCEVLGGSSYLGSTGSVCWRLVNRAMATSLWPACPGWTDMLVSGNDFGLISQTETLANHTRNMKFAKV